MFIFKLKRNFFSILLVLIVLTGCQAGGNAVAVSTSTTATYDPAAWAACTDNIDADYVKPGAQIVRYHITSHMLDPSNPGTIICTPRAIREKIKKAFDLYASIPDYNVAFQYAGEDTAIYTSPNDMPNDGTIHIALTIQDTKPMSILWGTFGPIHTRANPTGTVANIHPGAWVWLPDGFISEMFFLHEIGHALGLSHTPAHGANMSYYGGAFNQNGNGEYLYFTEQERADLIMTATKPGSKIYSITGTVQSDYITSHCGGSVGQDVANLGGYVDVIAVDTTNGRSFAGIADNNGKFWINVTTPGNYRVVALPDTYPRSCDPTQVSPSWYIDNTTVTNNPIAGTVITLSDISPNTTGIIIAMPNMGTSLQAFDLDSHVSFPDPSTYSPPGSSTPLISAPMFLSPGESSKFTFRVNCSPFINANNVAISTCAPLTQFNPYGTSPDYSFSWVMTSSGGAGDTAWSQYTVTVTANAGAAPGFRLAIAKAAAGNTQVALMGVYILNGATKPSSFMTSLADQLLGVFDFTSLNPTYW